MSDQLKLREQAAATAAEHLQAKFEQMDIPVDIPNVPRETANGTNSLDETFFQSLIDGCHLDDDFLSSK